MLGSSDFLVKHLTMNIELVRSLNLEGAHFLQNIDSLVDFMMRKSHYLHTINLNGAIIGSTSMQSLLNGLKHCHFLHNLSLERQRVGECGMDLYMSFAFSDNLVRLDLSHNGFGELFTHEPIYNLIFKCK